MKGENLDIHKEAYNKNFKFFDDNLLMLSWYVQRMVKTLKSREAIKMLSLGIGQRVVCMKLIGELGHHLEKYLIIEGSSEIINEFINIAEIPPYVSVINSFFETFDTTEKFDVIEMGFILEHVDDPLLVIRKYLKFLKPGGSIFIAVPNARSLHRLIGHQAGILDNLYQLSSYDLSLGHKRYFDMASIVKLIISSGLRIVNLEGIFLKPFSSSQLTSLSLSPEVIDSLCSISIEYPEISNALYIQASL